MYIFTSYFYPVSLTTDIENTVIHLENSVDTNGREFTKYFKHTFMVNQSTK